MRNSDWARYEIMLAMDLYVQSGRKQLPPPHKEVVRLSHPLNRLPPHTPASHDDHFHNANDISMVPGNLFGVASFHFRGGLSRNNPVHAAVWADFIDQPDLLIRTVQPIEAASCTRTVRDPVEIMDDEDVFPSGRLCCLPASILVAKRAARQYLRRLSR